MKQEQEVRVAAMATLERIHSEYGILLSSGSFSLQKLFEPDHFRFDEFCREFTAHPQSEQLKAIAQEFGEKHGIWLANARHHITCALFLYPTAGFERMFAMMKNLTLGFYLNDVMGRDTFKFLPAERQEESRKMIVNMADLTESLSPHPDAHPLEWVNAGILQEFKDRSPREWFLRFLQVYCYHIGITHTDNNSDAQGHILGVFDYMERRCHLGGVHHILLWIEFSDGRFLDWDLLGRLTIGQSLRRLHWVTAAFAGLSNDLFSFEKEVIDHGSDSNLVMILALNHPGMPLKEAILGASEIVRNLLMELLALMNSIRQEILNIGAVYPALADQLNIHLGGIVRCVQASWMWHCHSKRYKRPVSLWEETILSA